jgi:perosamine synthetase
MSKIHYTKPSITELEIKYATDAATTGWGEKCYQYIKKFEELFQSHLDVRHAIATSSCTGALHMGLVALGVGPGDEVILGDINWIASAAPITYLSAKPILVDVLPDTWCIDPKKVESAITSKTKAIIAVHLYGNVCDMEALLDIGERYNIPVIEDAAEAIGSKWKSKRVGSIGSFGVFSFHGTKTITTGEGGMFVTQNEELFEKVLNISNHGRTGKQAKQFWPDMIGFKYKMSNIQAAIGCAQMERIDELVKSKRRIFNYYYENLRDLPIKMNPELPETINGYWMPSILVNNSVPFDREKLLLSFKLNNIDGRVFFWPLSMLSMFENNPLNTVSYSIYQRAINLPSYHDITETEMDRVIALVRNYFL